MLASLMNNHVVYLLCISVHNTCDYDWWCTPIMYTINKNKQKATEMCACKVFPNWRLVLSVSKKLVFHRRVCMLKIGILMFVYVEKNGIHKSMYTYFRVQTIHTYKNGNPQSTSTDVTANHLFLRKETLIFVVEQIHYHVRKKPKHFQVIKTKYPSKQFFLFQIKYYFIF